VGAWRHACLAQRDPAAAVDRFAEAYLGQVYSPRPDPAEVSRAARATLDALLGSDGAAAISGHPRITSHIVTARGLGPCSEAGGARLVAGLAGAAAANATHRRALASVFQRVVFSSAGTPPVAEDGFATLHCPLTADNVRAVLHATASIPFLLEGEPAIAGAPPGHYWDGGIIDYHFDPRRLAGDGLVLYPHFRSTLTPGWFDKFLPWRRLSPLALERLVLLCPAPAFVATLPHGRIPDRGDFRRLAPQERVDSWRQCMDRGEALAADFADLVAGGDPLRGVIVS
jgi:hypothetical protein